MTDGKREEELERELRAHLEPGETLLWSGRPWTGLILRAHEPFLIPFTLACAGMLYSIAAEILKDLVEAETSTPMVVLGALIFLPVFAAGAFYLFAGRFLFDSAFRRRTLYAVTDRRVLILSGLFWSWVRGRSLKRPTWIRAWRHFSGRMTIVFGPAPLIPLLILSSFAPRRFGPFVFEHIENGDEVLSFLAEMKGDVDLSGGGRRTADHVLRIMGVLSFALAAIMMLGIAMEIPVLVAVYGNTAESAGTVTGITLLAAYAVAGAAAAFCNGLLCWRSREEGAALPVLFHLTNGLFLAVNVMGLFSVWALWRCCTTGASIDPEFYIAVFLPLFIVVSGYFMLLVRHRWRWKGGILEW